MYFLKLKKKKESPCEVLTLELDNKLNKTQCTLDEVKVTERSITDKQVKTYCIKY